MSKLLNVSNHKFTEEQINDLQTNWEITEVIELPNELKTKWSNLTPTDYKDVCKEVISEAYKLEQVPYIHVAGFPAAVCEVVKEYPLCLYAYSERSSKEELQPDGTVKKVSIFNHKGFYRY
jgi:hypothetical protein